MEKRCYHCGEPLSEEDKVCPRCGADAHESRKPTTIYELRTYCAQKRVPLAQIRFFIGEDYREPRAFGIYQDDDGQFVVYKNKADGSRAIRYRAPTRRTRSTRSCRSWTARSSSAARRKAAA